MAAPVTRIEIVVRALNIDVAKVRGRRAWALCPFHEDHDATNFFVRVTGDHAGSYHCFACKVGGSLIDLVMKIRSCEFKVAKAFVEQSGRGYAPPRARVFVRERPPMLGRLRFKLPRECVMNEKLDEWVSLAQRYATKRGLTQDIIDRYRVGYAVDGRLSGRIIFPVYTDDTTIGSYQARSFVDAERKYLTPHESEAPDLDAMFGEHLWPGLEERDAICVTEGAINAIACEEATGYAVGSISGSDVRPGHVIKLATFERVLLLTDPDKAGDKAARGFASSLGRRSTTIRVRLPTGKDAADLTRAELNRAIARAVDVESSIIEAKE